jgi:hypothetical protein
MGGGFCWDQSRHYEEKNAYTLLSQVELQPAFNVGILVERFRTIF